MTFSLAEPQWLWLIAVAVPMVVAGWLTFTSMSRFRLIVTLGARAVLIALLALALAGASSVRTTDRAHLAVVVDASGSVQSFGPRLPTLGAEAASEQPTLTAIQRRLLAVFGRNAAPGVSPVAGGSSSTGPDDTVTLLAFDQQVRVVAAEVPVGAASDGQSIRAIGERPLTSAEGSSLQGSAVGSALRAALASIPADATGRVLLISDGLATDGDPRDLLRLLGAGSDQAAQARALVPVDVVHLPSRATGEVTVDSLDAPRRVSGGDGGALGTVPLTVTLTSSGSARGNLRLLQEGEEVDLTPGVDGDALPIELKPGQNVLSFRAPLSAGRLHRFTAVFEPQDQEQGQAPADTVLANNSASALTTSPGGGRVLIVEGSVEPASRSALFPLLRESGLEVVARSPASLEGEGGTLLSLSAFDLIVLSDVPADAVPPAVQQNIARAVTEVGVGLLMVGGPSGQSFGAGGWRGTPIEPVLPVSLDLPDKVVMPSAAVVIVLDSSGSMNASVLGSTLSQQQVANRGAVEAVGSLDRQDLVGVVEFASRASWVVPLGPNSDARASAARIEAITPRGGTNLPPALDLAFEALQPVRAQVKHVIVLSDGQSQGRGRLPQIAAKFKSAQGGPVRISTIAVGDGADTRGLEQLAKATGGEYYRVIDPTLLPRIFVKAVRVVRTPAIRNEPFVPVLTSDGLPLFGVGEPPRSLGGLVLTRPKIDALKREVPGVSYLLLAPGPAVGKEGGGGGEPVLAVWRAGLGQAGAFTSSPPPAADGPADTATWGQQWTTSAARSVWVRLVRSLMRSSSGWADASGTAAVGGGGATGSWIDLETRFERGGDSVGGVPRAEVLQVRAEIRRADGSLDQSRRDDRRLMATVYTPVGGKLQAVLAMTAPGIYQATIDPEQVSAAGIARVIDGSAKGGEGAYVVIVSDQRGASAEEAADDGAATATLSTALAPALGGAVSRPAATAEYAAVSERSMRTGREVLTQLAKATGGRVIELADLHRQSPAALLGRDRSVLPPGAAVPPPRESRTPLWPWLVPIALAVMMLDIASRRVAWDRAAERGRDTVIATAATTAASVPASVLSVPGTGPSAATESPLAAAKRRAQQKTLNR